MLTFRAINDYKGIRKGQVWELEKCFEEDMPELLNGWKRRRYMMVRNIDDIVKTIILLRYELEENFEWVK